MIDTEDRIKNLISQIYKPGSPDGYDVRMSTYKIYVDLCTIIPSTAFDEYDVLQALEELGYIPQYERKKEVINEQTSETKEFDDVKFFWYFKKI